MENIRVVLEPGASPADVDFVRDGLSLFNVAATAHSYYSPLVIFLREGRDAILGASPESGEYVVPGTLEPIRVDREHDLGRYDEPNVWMRHPIRQRSATPNP